MPTNPATTQTPINRARAALLMASGRVTGASEIMLSALAMVDTVRREGDAQISDVARERLGRLALEVSAKTNEFRRELEELMAAQ